MSASGKSLRHGVMQSLLAAAKAKGHKLSAAEVKNRIQAARTYTTETEIRTACELFGSWSELCEAKFPAVNVPDDVPELEAEDPVPVPGDGWCSSTCSRRRRRRPPSKRPSATTRASRG